MNIINTTTPKSRQAVERFSGRMRAHVMPATHMMSLKALRSAPFSRCIRDNIRATVMTTAPLASSEGWNWMPKNSHQRAAPLVLLPEKRVIIRNNNETGSKRMGTALNILHGTLWMTTAITVPSVRKPACFSRGSQKLPLL